jgi:Melibiase/Glycosyl hydrolase family 36 C-terminal domain
MTATDYRCSRFRQAIDGIFAFAALLVGPALAASALVSASATPTAHQLASADTFIVVEAGAHAPRLLGMGWRGARQWESQAQDGLPDHVTTDAGATLPIEWHLNAASSRFDRVHVSLVYESNTPRLRLNWLWRARTAHGPLEHSIRIDNLGNEQLWLPLQPSLRFDWRIDAAQPLARFWVEKGDGTPSTAGVHHDALREGDPWTGTSSTYAHPRSDEPREMIPFLLVERADSNGNSHGNGVGWYLGIEFSGRTHITLARTGNSLRGEAGLNPDPGPYRTRLAPGESFETPTVFLGAFRGNADDAGNILRPWVRAVLNNPATLRDTRYPLLVNNSWGSGFAVDEALAQRMIQESRELGLEMYALDAGWFRAVGDWRADPRKFPHGLASVADAAHRAGLRFGLWVDWAQAGLSTAPAALNVHDARTRDWLIADPPPGWRQGEAFKGLTIDLGVPAAHQWAAAETERLVSENHLDMLEHDGYLVAQGSVRDGHPAAPPDPATLHQYEDAGFQWVDGSNSTDVSYHATRAYYDIQERLRRQHPGLLLEICNDGGRMVDFGSAAHGDYFSITDSYDPLSNRRAFFDASHVLPPAMLESYVERWPTPSAGNFRYMLRSGMMGWFTLMLDSSRWTAEQHTAAHAEFALYKSALRPLIRAADLYHAGVRPDGVHWDGIEYFSPPMGQGVLFAFRGNGPDEVAHRFPLRGLDPAGRYRVRFNDRGPAADYIGSGRDLLRDGVQVRLPEPLTSELVFITQVHSS